MLIKPNWDNFKAKFSENPQDNFEWFCYLLFSKEYNQPYGTHRYKNQSGIETDPIEVNDEVIGWQSKFYDIPKVETLNKDLKETLRKAKRDYPNISKIVFYTNMEWTKYYKDKNTKAEKTVAQKEIEELFVKEKIELVLRMDSYFDSFFVCQKQREISRHFFELDSKWELTNLGFKDRLKKEYEDIFKNSYNNLDVKNLLLEKKIKMATELRNGKSRVIDFDKFVNISNKSLILTNIVHIKNNFYKSIAYLWGQGEIYQEFQYLIYLSLKRWRQDGLKSLIRDNYYTRDENLITLDIKKNSKNILFLFDGLDMLHWEKRDDLLKEINEYGLKYYAFISSQKRGVFAYKEFKFDESFSLSTLRLPKSIEKKDYFTFKVKVFNYLKNYYEALNIEFSISIDEKLYSHDIEKNLVFDIVVELFPPLNMLMIIKCFDSLENVSLQTIQNLYNQKKEVNAQKIIIVSSDIFEQNIIQYAKKRKREIALLHYEDTDNSEWLLHRSPTTLVNWENERLNQKTIGHENYGNSLSQLMINLLPTNSQKQFFSSALTLAKRSKNNYKKVKFLDDETINRVVDNLLVKMNYEKGMVDFEKIASILEKENHLKIHYNRVLADNVLGEINFEKSIISIDNHQCDTLARMRFTVAHEIGHYLLGHARYMYGEKYTKMQDEKIGNKLSEHREEIVRMEWQANQFASFLLLPRDKFLEDIKLLFIEFDVRGNSLYVDNQKYNTIVFMEITNRLMQKYKVSRAVVEIRLKKLGLLQKVDVYESVKNIYQKIGNNRRN